MDVLGYRKKLAVLAPSTNTVVGWEFPAFCPTGVTAHVSDVAAQDKFGAAASDETGDVPFKDAVRRALLKQPDAILCCTDAELGDPDPAPSRPELFESNANCPVFFPRSSVLAALDALGGIRRLGLIGLGERHVKHAGRAFQEAGYDIVGSRSIEADRPVLAAHVTYLALREAVADVDSDNVDAIVQLGANLPIGVLVEDLERIHGKPVIASNMALCWRALRAVGINDVVPRFGQIFKDH